MKMLKVLKLILVVALALALCFFILSKTNGITKDLIYYFEADVSEGITEERLAVYEEVIERISWASILAMLFTNIVFYIVDCIKNDTVWGRRFLQLVLNIVLIVAGTFYLWLSIQTAKKGMFDGLIVTSTKQMTLFWYPLVYLAATMFIQFIFDCFVCCGQNRDSLLDKILRKKR